MALWQFKVKNVGEEKKKNKRCALKVTKTVEKRRNSLFFHINRTVLKSLNSLSR